MLEVDAPVVEAEVADPSIEDWRARRRKKQRKSAVKNENEKETKSRRVTD